MPERHRIAITLRQKALMVITGICLLALISVGSSLWFATVTDSDASAINIAGSLRMQSWRLAEHVLIPELTSTETLGRLVAIYDSSLQSEPLIKWLDSTSEMGDAYRQVLSQWRGQMKPLLQDAAGYEAFIDQVPAFVDLIDDMVTSLQRHTEKKLQQLFITALVVLIGILAMGVLVLRFINRHLLKPMEDLGRAAARIQNGSFDDVNLIYEARNEMGNLTRTFQDMASDLGRLYGQLESKVNEKTQALSQSNHALELLYEASQNLATNPYDEVQVVVLLQKWKVVLGLKECFLCISDTANSQLLQKVADDGLSRNCNTVDCSGCKLVTDVRGDDRIQSEKNWQFPLVAKNNDYGFLKVSVEVEQGIAEDSRQWLQTFADIVATSLYQSSMRTRVQRMLLIEERAVIARELHDSLAQAMSYQKIQVARLRRQLQHFHYDPSVMSILDELGEGIGNAYVQLRELLKTFRLSLPEDDLRQTLQKTVEEFRERSQEVQFSLNYQLRYCPIDAHDQIHIVQIVREALVNVIKHARAAHAEVHCYQTVDRQIRVAIEDDGCGIQGKSSASGHYGTTIMRERAATMKGILTISNVATGGTSVTLEFQLAEEIEHG
ncbi:ATP-binding protein [Endozoicomonas ascidiicola]|uniref:ATP-binding protein n=1 Tax=Endozoicomonas ascidiicola TaxID=1698521 RepID=UPI0012F8336E|nr:ATP-binding protein [Endozoicomonas ascidiicola]